MLVRLTEEHSYLLLLLWAASATLAGISFVLGENWVSLGLKAIIPEDCQDGIKNRGL